MGISLYLKAYTDSQGKSQLELKARSRGQHFSRALFKISRDSWDSSRLRIKSTSPLAAKYNPQIAEIKELMYSSYDLYEAGIYSFEELTRRLKGGSSNLDMISFAEDIYKGYKQVSYNNIINALKAWKRAQGTNSLLFTDMSYTSMTATINKLKQTHAPSSINSYIGFLSSTTNEAYRRGIVDQKFVSYRKYYQKVHLRQADVVTPEMFEEAITKIKTLYDWQALAFWLLSFCMRGLYHSDLVKLHLHETKNESDSEAKRYVMHKRSKTGQPMQILYSVNPTEAIINTLQKSIIHTHGVDTRDTNLRLFDYDTEDYFKHKSIWAVYGKNTKALLGYSLKTARKTFESIAVALDVSVAIRYSLLGHLDSSIKRHYVMYAYDKIIKKVDKAHKKILKDFEAKRLWQILEDKYYTMTDDEKDLYIG